jgi:hypothetical protein
MQLMLLHQQHQPLPPHLRMCNGDSNGTITVTPTSGVAPFTFDLSGTGSNTTGDANGFYTGLPAVLTRL